MEGDRLNTKAPQGAFFISAFQLPKLYTSVSFQTLKCKSPFSIIAVSVNDWIWSGYHFAILLVTNSELQHFYGVYSGPDHTFKEQSFGDAEYFNLF
jgi:hypothetical protein